MNAAAYISFFRIRFAAGLQYRAAALAGIATQFAWGLMEIRMFMAFIETNPSAIPMEPEALFSYIWLQQALLAMFMPWIYDNSIFSQIGSGGVALELCRPTDLYTMWFVRNCSMRLSRVVLRCFPIFVVSALLPTPYGICAPSSISTFLLFFISLWLGFGVVIAFLMLVYISAFYTINSYGVKLFVATIAEFCAGAVIPLPFLPDKMRDFLSLLPFASMSSTPFLIYGGTIPGLEALHAVLLQLFWLVTLVIVGKLWMRDALRRVVVQGG